MALKIPFPYHPANKFHAGIKVRFEAEAETPQSIDLLADKVDNGSKGTQKAIGDVARAIKGFPDGEQSKQIFERLTVAIETVAAGLQKQPNGEAIDRKLGEIGKSLHQIDRTMQSFGVPERDNVTALYAAAVDTTGDIVGRTTAGQWLNQAKFASLHEIVAFQKGKPQDVRRTEFIKRVRGVPAIDHGLPAVISDSELVRFFELAPAVWKAIEDSPDASSQQPPKA